ncbi:MAG: cytidine deaminase [Armatimonadetes bacterium]|nr:cytidine deaminase [Armatimonadota bacterium]
MSDLTVTTGPGFSTLHNGLQELAGNNSSTIQEIPVQNEVFQKTETPPADVLKPAPVVSADSEETRTYRKLLDAATDARLNAYAPTSHYLVGAAILTKSGKIYTGCNTELTAYADHGEQVAIGKAQADGETEIVAIALQCGSEGKPLGFKPESNAPCGNCRQALFECNPDLKVILPNGPEGMEVHTVRDLLPVAYQRKREPWNNPQVVEEHFSDPLVEEALIARSNARVPRSHYPVGAAVETADGRIFRGSKIEASSFSSQAERLAMANAISQGAKDIVRIAIVGGNDPHKGETPLNMTWDSFQAIAQVAPNAVVLLPDETGEFIAHSMREFPSFLVVNTPKPG